MGSHTIMSSLYQYFFPSPFSVEGTVAPGYQPVRQLFEENFQAGEESCAQLCVYLGEERIIDLYGSLDVPDGNQRQEFGPDSLIPIFSTSKILSSIVIATLVDKGLLDYSHKVRDIFPEFCSRYKDDTGTLMDLMRHELGLPILSKTVMRDALVVKNIKNNSVGKLLEEENLVFKPGSKRDYHMMTRGLIANELVRRVDREGRTIGEIMRTNLSVPLQADVHLGLLPMEMKKAVDVEYLHPLKFWWRNLFNLGSITKNLFMQMFSGESLPVPPIEGFSWVKLGTIFSFFNSDLGRTAELPSLNANCSARGLAIIGACMANHGRFKGVQILSEDAWSALHSDPTEKLLFNKLKTNLTTGGVQVYPNGWVGWGGIGGSTFQWHPQLGLSFAYIPTYLDWGDLTFSKAANLQARVEECLKNTNNKH